MWEKFKKIMQSLCHSLELVAAVLVLLGILLSMISLLTDRELFRSVLQHTEAFMHYLEQIFTIVIGIEFLQMLCRPNSDNVIEIVIFLVARHMIVGETTPYEDLVSVVSLAILCILRRYLRDSRENGAPLEALWRKKNTEKKEVQ